MMKNFIKKICRWYKGKQVLLILLFTGLLISSGIYIKQLLFPPLFLLYHGPHLNIAMQKNIDDEEILGTKSRRNISGYKRNPTPTPVPATPTPSPTVVVGITAAVTLSPVMPTNTVIPINIVPSPTFTPTSTLAANPGNYGIAAGGILMWLNQTDLDRYFGRLKDLGVGWVRWDFEWGLIQPSGPGSYDWSAADRVLNTAKKYGIDTLGTIAYAPVWARLSVCKSEFACAPADPNAFGVFAGQVAARYAPMGVHHWEIWNEPNIPQFWKPAPNVNDYVAILKSAYFNIKKVDQSAVVLTAGLAAADDENNNISTLNFIRQLYDNDLTKDFDAIAVHPYTYPFMPSYPASWSSWQQIETIRQIMVNKGDKDKQIWITEIGAPTGGPGTVHDVTWTADFVWGKDYLTETAQAQLINDALSLFSQFSQPVGPFFWYSLIDLSTDKSTPENFFGLLRFDGSKKPAYAVLQSAIQGSL